MSKSCALPGAQISVVNEQPGQLLRPLQHSGMSLIASLIAVFMCDLVQR